MGVQPDQGAYDGPQPTPSDNKRKRKRQPTADTSPIANKAAPPAALRHDDGDEELVSVGSVAGVKKKAKKPQDPSPAGPPAEKRLRRFVLHLHLHLLLTNRFSP